PNGFLNFTGVFRIALPKIGDDGRNFNDRLDSGTAHGTPMDGGVDAIAIDPPFRRAAIRRQAAVQEAGSGSVLVGNVAPHNSAEFLDVEVGVLDFERIEGPLDEVDVPVESFVSLRELELASYSAIAVLRQHAQHVAVQIALRTGLQTRDGEAKADHPFA